MIEGEHALACDQGLIMLHNDNDITIPRVRPLPDAHGHAALLLVESLVHELIDRSIITTRTAIEIIEIADSVQVDVAEAADEHGGEMWRAHGLLVAIANSLRQDDPDASPLLHCV